MHELVNDVLQPLAVFGGIALVIWVSAKARLEAKKQEIMMYLQQHTPAASQDQTVLNQLKTMQEEMREMQQTGHQFDLSFDAALSRLEERVSAVEAKNSRTPNGTVPTPESPVPQTQTLGQR